MSLRLELHLPDPGPPDEYAVAEALAPFGSLRPHKPRGTHRLIEGDETPDEAVEVRLSADAPANTRIGIETPHGLIELRAMPSASRSYWMARAGLALQQALGGVVHLPDDARVHRTAEEFAAAMPEFHQHGHHD